MLVALIVWAVFAARQLLPVPRSTADIAVWCAGYAVGLRSDRRGVGAAALAGAIVTIGLLVRDSQPTNLADALALVLIVAWAPILIGRFFRSRAQRRQKAENLIVELREQLAQLQPTPPSRLCHVTRMKHYVP